MQVDSEKHLGVLYGNNTQTDNVNNLCREMMSKTNMLRCHFNQLSIYSLYHLFKTYCMPLYACQVLNITQCSMKKLFVTWRKCMRHLFDLPYRTHNNLLPLIIDNKPIENQIYIRVYRFVCKLMMSENELIRVCVKTALHGSHSNVSERVSFLSALTGSSRFSPRSILKTLETRETVNEEDERTASFILDVLTTRHNGAPASGDDEGLTRDELSLILTDLCTSCN
eukprot:GHVO01064328.1.p1 GENE.GHVO01064328.1~~GHVO01064328.1.p1  ORF type:complete len:225 (-),score=0.53 GHVO01064328.1:88-762(-)